jgi:TonB-dependent starch-binding outer membrane protein SusC
MTQSSVRRTLRLALATAVSLFAYAVPAAAQDGVITGHVVDATSRAPVPTAQIQLVGTTRGTVTADDGTFRIAGIRPGQYQVRVLRLGFTASGTRTVQVTAGGTSELDFALTPAAVSLEEVVTTATGEKERKREIGSAVSTLQPTTDEITSAQSVSQLLTGKVSGVDVAQAGGTVGGGSRIRIRGANSISLGNEPLIIVDGIKFNNSVSVNSVSGANSIDVGGQVPSRFNDINPEDIESIEILKGPAAAAQYGTAAANGVLQITTKRGRSGSPRWNTFLEGGTIKDVTTYPANFTQKGLLSDGTAAPFPCDLNSQTLGLCTPTGGLTSFNPLVQYSPFITGHHGAYGTSVTGGSDQVTYYFSGNFDKQQGVFEINTENRASGRANISVQLRDNWNVQIGTSYLADHLRLPQNDNNILGILPGGLLGGTADDPLAHGYLAGQTPQEIFAINTKQDVQRFENSINTSYQPLSWLTATGVAGLDYLGRYDNELVPPNQVFFGDLGQGNRTSNPYSIYNYTANGTLSAAFTPFTGIKSTTKVSGLFSKELVRGTQAFGAVLLGGTGSLAGATARFAVGETNTDNKTVSRLVREDLAFWDRVFFSAALRNDKNSAFGQNFGSINYPSFTLSWVVNEEPFFPKTNWVSSLRLRAANGRSGQKPNFRDAITFFNAQTVTVNSTDVPGITVGGTGNINLKPERSRETELGFDAGFFGDRLGLEVTHYDKRTDDLLIAVPLPPSLGLTATQFKNLGSVSNKGWEFLANAKVLDVNPVALNFTVSASTNENKVLSLGEISPGVPVPPIIFGNQEHQVGLPLGSYFGKSVTFKDANGDGIISASEIAVSDTNVFLGNPLPKREMSVTPELTLFKLLRISALIDHKGGYKLFDFTRRFRCAFGVCQEAFDKNAPLVDQAANIAIPFGTDALYVEDASFTKLRELSFTLIAPEGLRRMVGGRAMELSIAGRNLHTWTHYKGFDPESNSTPGGNFDTSDFLTLPPTRSWTARVNINF